jgi:3-dehydroquinate dehydratase type I
MFCIPIVARDQAEALKKIEGSAPQADLIEIRLDMIGTFSLKELISATPKPVLITYRSVKEGGMGTAEPETVAGTLIEAVRLGARYVDVEYGLHKKWRDMILRAEGNTRFILSSHFIKDTPSKHDLRSLLIACAAEGTGIVKIVTRANHWEDNWRVLDLIAEARNLNTDVIAFCMGSRGRVSRILSLPMGGFLTFASSEAGGESASGQIPIHEMKKWVEFFES